MNTAGVAETATYLAKKQAEGWKGSSGIHGPLGSKSVLQRRASNAKTLAARLAKQVERS